MLSPVQVNDTSVITIRIIEDHVVRDGDYYFYSRYVDGRTITMGRVIGAGEAKEIVEGLQKEAGYSARGEVTFEPGAFEFSVLCRWVESS